MKKKKVRYAAHSHLKNEILELDNLNNERKGLEADIGKRKKDVYNEFYAKQNMIKAEVRLKYLLPSYEFPPLVLQDCKRINMIKENSIFFVVSNDGSNSIPEIIVVYSNINGNLKTYYVKNKTTTNKVDYVERQSIYGGCQLCYKIVPRKTGGLFKWLKCDNHISVVSEYKTGINEFSFVGKDLIDIGTIIEKLILELKDNPRIKLGCSETKKVLKKALEESLDKKTYKKISLFL